MCQLKLCALQIPIQYCIKYYRDCHLNSFSITLCGLIAVTGLLAHTAPGYCTLFYRYFQQNKKRWRQQQITVDRLCSAGLFYIYIYIYVYVFIYLSPLMGNFVLFFIFIFVFLSVFWTFLFHVFCWQVHKY